MMKIELQTIKQKNHGKNYLIIRLILFLVIKSTPELIFPGSFNPLHDGHLRMRELAEKKTGMRATFEICAKKC